MTAERARKRAEKKALKNLKAHEKWTIGTLKQEIKNMSDCGETTCMWWVDIRYIQNVKEYFDKLGYRTEIQDFQVTNSNKLYISWGRQEEK